MAGIEDDIKLMNGGTKLKLMDENSWDMIVDIYKKKFVTTLIIDLLINGYIKGLIITTYCLK